MQTLVIFLTSGRLLLQIVESSSKKMLVDDKITACIKQICLLGVTCTCIVSNTNTLSGETFCFHENFLLSIFKFHALSNLLFSYELLIGPQPIFVECIA